MYLKVSPIRGTRRFQVRGKLAPRYIGPFKILKKVGAVAYRLELPEEMSESARGTSPDGSHGPTAGLTISGKTYKDFGRSYSTNEENHREILSSPVEQPHGS